MRDKEKNIKRALLWLIALSPLTLIVFINLPTYAGFSNDALKSYSYTVAKAAGITGIFLLLWQQILGNRFIVKLFLQDLSWSISLHRKFGIYGILLFLAHPLLMASYYGADLLLNTSPDLSNQFERYTALGRLALFLILFIWITSFALRSKLKYRPWKYIHYTAYLILPLVFIHASQISSTINSSRIAELVWYLVISTYIWALTMRLMHFLGLGQVKYKLIIKKNLTTNIFQYVLEPYSKKIVPKRGQFIYLRRGLLSEEHPFTVADYDKKTGNITIISKVFGKYTKKLSGLKIDSLIRLDGPYGKFTEGIKPSKPSVLIAGGIGITPFLSHIREEKNKHLFLFNCNQAISNAALRKELKDTLGNRYVDVISENSKGKNIETGYISAEIIQKYISKNITKLDFYICGPPAMMNAISENLKNAGVDEHQIYLEKFSF